MDREFEYARKLKYHLNISENLCTLSYHIISQNGIKMTTYYVDSNANSLELLYWFLKKMGTYVPALGFLKAKMKHEPKIETLM